MADKFKVRATRGFRAVVDGRMEIVNEGDVVELTTKDDYLSVLSTNRAEAVPLDTPGKRQKNFVPAYKRERLAGLKTAAASA